MKISTAVGRLSALSLGLIPLLIIAGTKALAGGIAVTVDSMANVSGNGAIEACGSVSGQKAGRPVQVTIKHDQALYSTLAASNGKWCILFKRWTYDGNIDASAETLGAARVERYTVSASLPIR